MLLPGVLCRAGRRRCRGQRDSFRLGAHGWKGHFQRVFGFATESDRLRRARARSAGAVASEELSLELNEVVWSAPCEDQQVVCEDGGPHGCDVVFPAFVVTPEQSQHSLEE